MFLSELSNQGKYVISRGSIRYPEDRTWKLLKPERVFGDATSQFGPDSEAVSLLKCIFAGRLRDCVIFESISVDRLFLAW